MSQVFKDGMNAMMEPFFRHLAKRYRNNLSHLRTDWQAYMAGELETLEDNEQDLVQQTTTQISTLTKADVESTEEVKTKLEGSLESTDTEEPVPVTNIPEATTENDDSSSVSAEPLPVTTKKGKKAQPVVIEDESSSSSSSESSIVVEPPKVTKGKKVEKKEKSESSDKSLEIGSKSSESDDEDSEDDIQVEEESSEDKPAPKKKAATAKSKKEQILELADTPAKLPVKDRPKIPKGVKFVKGTNYAVHNNVVIAACTKKGFVKLTGVNTKAMDSKGIKYLVVEQAEIKKRLKC